MKVWYWTAGILLFLFAAMLAESVREQKRFRVTEYGIVSKKLNGLNREWKIVFLSDLHNHVYGEHNAELTAAIAKETPDLILLTGDMLVGKPGKPWKETCAFVADLRKFCPVYYANGNHEQRMKEHPEKYGKVFELYKERLENSGITFLENTSEKLWLGQCPVCISGLEIPERFYRKFRKMKMTVKDVKKCLGKADRQSYQILLGHNPTYCKTYAAWGADLILSGHLHGGIVRLPGIGGVIDPEAGLFPRHSGEMKAERNAQVVVSKGLGTHTVNLRLFNPAELVVLHLKPCENTENPI